MSAPAVSVVVPTRDKASRLRVTLACLAGQLGAPTSEIVLVDDGSTDDTAGVAAAAPVPVRVVAGGGRGRAAARNTGARAARAPYLVFLDDDVLVGPGFLAAHHALAGPDRFVHGGLRELPTAERFLAETAGADPARLAGHHRALAGGTARGRHRLVANALERAVEAMDGGTLPDAAPWLGCVGANTGMPHARWSAAGGFDEGFGTGWGCEDLELGLRLYRAGCRRVLAPSALGLHLSHARPGRWTEHDANLARFRRLHPVPGVELLGELLGARGDPARYVDAVLAAGRGTAPLREVSGA